MPSISSTLVFVPDERIWYKSPHGVLEVLTYMTLKMKEMTSLSYTINFDICSKQGLHVVKYKTVLYDPLKIEFREGSGRNTGAIPQKGLRTPGCETGEYLL